MMAASARKREHDGHDIGYSAYVDGWDARYCATCNEWLEQQCSDPQCVFCAGRPAKPLPLTINQRAIEDLERIRIDNAIALTKGPTDE